MVRLVELAAEIGTTPDELAERLDPNSVLLDAVGFRCTERHVAVAVIDQHRAAQAARQRRARERRERLTEASQRMRESLRGGVPVTSDDPLADLMAGDPDSAIERSGRAMDDLIAGRLTYHPGRPA